MKDLHESRAEYWETLAMRLAFTTLVSSGFAIAGWAIILAIVLKGCG